MNPWRNQQLVQETEKGLPGSIRITPPASARDALSLGKQGRSIIEKETTPQGAGVTIGFKICYGTELVSWAVAGIAAFAFVVVVITPILVPLMSLGSVFAEGWREWSDFAVTAWKMSVNPALISLMSAALALALRKGKAAMERRLSAESEKSYELRRLEGLIKPNIQ